jgi:hypothetical protein
MLKRISENFNLKIIFKTGHNFGRYLRRTKSLKDVQERSQYVYRFSCECGTLHIDETDRPLSIRLKKRRGNLKQVGLGKSKLTHHAFEEGHKISWTQAEILRLQPVPILWKYKETARMF